MFRLNDRRILKDRINTISDFLLNSDCSFDLKKAWLYIVGQIGYLEGINKGMEDRLYIYENEGEDNEKTFRH